MSASSRRPTLRFQPGMAAMKACTGASPSAFAICGLPPERSTTFSPFRTLAGLAFAFAATTDLDLVADLRGLLARDVPLAFDFALFIKVYRFFNQFPTARTERAIQHRRKRQPP